MRHKDCTYALVSMLTKALQKDQEVKVRMRCLFTWLYVLFLLLGIFDGSKVPCGLKVLEY